MPIGNVTTYYVIIHTILYTVHLLTKQTVLLSVDETFEYISLKSTSLPYTSIIEYFFTQSD